MDIFETLFGYVGSASIAFLILGIAFALQQKVFVRWIWCSFGVSFVIAAAILTGHAWGFY